MHREFTLGRTEEPGYEIGAPRVILAPKKKHFSFFYFFLVAIAKLVMQTSVKVLGRKGIIGTFESQHSARKKSRLWFDRIRF